MKRVLHFISLCLLTTALILCLVGCDFDKASSGNPPENEENAPENEENVPENEENPPEDEEDAHAWELDYNFSPTCSSNGCIIYKCSDCGEFKEDIIPPTGIHTPGEEYFTSKNEHWHECTVCHEKLSVESHSFENELCAACHTYETYYEITVWVQNGYVNKAIFTEKIAEFAEANRMTIKLDLMQVDSAVAGNKIMHDPSCSADLFCFTQKELQGLVDAKALMPLENDVAEIIVQNNSSASVSTAELGGVIYGYPLAIINRTSVMFYDRSLISEEDAKSLDRIIAICEENGKSLRFQVDSGWGVSHFFMATGCHSTWTMNKNWEFIGIDDNYNSDAGIIALKGLDKLISSPCLKDEYYSATRFDYDENTAVIISELSGRWTAKNTFRDNLGVAALPYFTVDGESYQLGSYIATTIFGVKPTEDRERAKMLSDLALWLTSEESQADYYETFEWTPTNTCVQQSDAVLQNIYISAQIEQSHVSTPELHCNLYWHGLIGEFCKYLKDATSDDDYALILEEYDRRLKELFETGYYS